MTTITVDTEHHHGGLYDGAKQIVLPTELQLSAAYNAARQALDRLTNPAKLVKSIELHFFQPYGGRYLWLKFCVTIDVQIGSQTELEHKILGEHTSPVNPKKESALTQDYADSIIQTIETACKDLGRDLRSAGDRVSRSVKKSATEAVA